jgi:hypothetical protein
VRQEKRRRGQAGLDTAFLGQGFADGEAYEIEY